MTRIWRNRKALSQQLQEDFAHFFESGYYHRIFASDLRFVHKLLDSFFVIVHNAFGFNVSNDDVHRARRDASPMCVIPL